MRKHNPATTAGLSAVLALGIGTAVVVSAGVMTQGPLPTASATTFENHINAALMSPIQVSNDSVGGVPNPADPAHVVHFQGTGNYQISAAGLSGGTSTGPFSLEVKLNEVWRNGAWDNEYEDPVTLTVTGTEVNTPGRRVNCSPITASDGTIGFKVDVLDGGLYQGDIITVNFTAKSSFRFAGADPASSIVSKSNALSSAAMDDSNITIGTDWTHPGIFPAANWFGDSNSATIYPGQSVNGQFRASVTSNSAGVWIQNPVCNNSITGVNLQITSGGWFVEDASGNRIAENLSFSDTSKQDIMAGGTIGYDFTISASDQVDARSNPKVSVSSQVYISGKSDVSGSAANSVAANSGQVTIANPVINLTSLTVNKSTVTTGDEVLVTAKIKASSFHYVAFGRLRLAIHDPGNLQNVAFVEGPEGSSVSAGDVIIPFYNLTPAEQTFTVKVKAGNPDDIANLSGKDCKINYAVAGLGASQGIASLPLQASDASFSIVAPTAEGKTTVDDPALDVSTHTEEENIVVNIGDTAEFIVRVKNTSNSVPMKGLTLSDALSVADLSGNAVDPSTGKVSIVDNPQLFVVETQGDATVETPVSSTVQYGDTNKTSFVLTPQAGFELAPQQTAVIRYKVKVSNPNIRAMRGGSVMNSPIIGASNIIPSQTGGNPVGVTMKPGKVTAALAQISPQLMVTDEEVPMGGKTTYVLTVQSVKPEGVTTVTAENYAIGLHVTATLDPYSHSLGYAYNRDTIKLYQVSGGNMVEVPATDYDVTDDKEDPTKFVLSIKDEKASLHRIKVVSEAVANTSKTGGNTDTPDIGEKPTVNSESVVAPTSAPATTNAGKGAPKASVENATTATTDKGAQNAGVKTESVSIKQVAQELREGYILTYDGSAKGVTALTGRVTTNADALVRADNAGYAVDSKSVILLGSDVVVPTEGVLPNTKEGSTLNNANPNQNPNSSNKKNVDAGQLPPMASSVPAVLGVMVASIASLVVARRRQLSKR